MFIGKTLEFISWATTVLERVPKTMAVHNQLDRASTSIPLNIAEGTRQVHCAGSLPLLTIRHSGSALECAASLDVLVAKRVLQPNEIVEAKRSPATDRGDARRVDQVRGARPNVRRSSGITGRV